MSAASTPLLDFYRWGFPSVPLQIHLSLEVVNGIRRQIQERGKAPNARSQCGLLIGISQPGITRILDFEPFETLDTASLEAAMLSASGEVVGFYRTASAGSPSMSNEDRDLALQFPRPSSVFLLIETIKSSIGNARFCCWNEGELFDQLAAAFPFVAEALAPREAQPQAGVVRKLSQSLRAGVTPMTPPPDQEGNAAPESAPRLAAPQTALQPVAAPAPLAVPRSDDRQKSIAPVPVTQPQQTTGRSWWTLLLLAALLIASLSFGAFSYFRPGARLPVVPPAAAPPGAAKTSLGLAVEKRGDGLLVSWNGDSPIIAKANFGMLLIRGTGVSRDVPLTVEELRAGGFVYALAADEMRLQLNIVAGEQVAREFLTVVRPLTPDGPAGPANPRSGNSNGAALPAPPVVRKPVAVAQPLPEVKPFKPVAPSQPAAAPPLRMEEPPAAGRPATVNTGNLSLLNRPPVSVAAPVEGQVKENPSPLSVQAQPPVATHKVIPGLPTILRGHLWNATAVDVKLSVDASGNVVKAEAVAKPDLNPALREEALQAARWWKFQAASFNGHPVPAEIVVRFNFAASR
jgi:TonB family protein